MKLTVGGGGSGGAGVIGFVPAQQVALLSGVSATNAILG